MKRTLVLGGPGAGKTTRLLQVMEAALERGVPSDRIAFTTFTRAAAREARDRACRRFGLVPDDLPYFRTLHSLCFRELALRHTDVMGNEHLAELAEITGELQAPGYDDAEGPAAGASADPLLTVDQYARTTRSTLRDAWQDHGGQLDWYRLKRFSDAYARYRRDRDLMDFTDMLAAYADGAGPAAPVDVAIVDEAQDLTLLQWAVVARAFAGASELWAGGDDDQSVHQWAGAAEEHFLTLPFRREVLPLSHRLPREVFDLSLEVAGRISRRYEKSMASSGRAGAVSWAASAQEADLSSGTWLMLARTRRLLNPMVAEARAQGVTYSVKGRPSVRPEHVAAIQGYEALRAGRRVGAEAAAVALLAMGARARQVEDGRDYSAADLKIACDAIWHDALIRIPLGDREYYLTCLRRGARLQDPPRVRVETVHGSKGLEAERVLLGTDLSQRTQAGYALDPDSEHRVFYVGVTRASESLTLIAPRGVYGYRL